MMVGLHGRRRRVTTKGISHRRPQERHHDYDRGNIARANRKSAQEQSYISEAVLIGDGKKFVTALIEIDFGSVSEWARQNKVIYTSFSSLASHEKIVDLIAHEVLGANEQLARVEQVKKFRIIPKELDPEEGDTTPTRKIKRKHLHALFEDLIDDMYANEPIAGLTEPNGSGSTPPRPVNQKIHA